MAARCGCHAPRRYSRSVNRIELMRGFPLSHLIYLSSLFGGVAVLASVVFGASIGMPIP